jgi:hypothetical protein
MFWEKVFGSMLLEKIKKYCEPRKMSITALVRIAVEKFLNEEERESKK